MSVVNDALLMAGISLVVITVGQLATCLFNLLIERFRLNSMRLINSICCLKYLTEQYILSWAHCKMYIYKVLSNSHFAHINYQIFVKTVDSEHLTTQDRADVG